MEHVSITSDGLNLKAEEFSHFPSTLERALAVEARLGSSKIRPLIVPLAHRGGYVFSRFHIDEGDYVFRVQPGIHGIEPRGGEDSFETLQAIVNTTFYGNEEGHSNAYVAEEGEYFKTDPVFGIRSRLHATEGDRYYLIIRQFDSRELPRITRPIEVCGFVPAACKRDYTVCVLFEKDLHQDYVNKRLDFYRTTLRDVTITHRVGI